MKNNKYNNGIVDTETRARIVEETGKVVGDFIKVIALRPKRTKPPETPPSEVAKTAPKTEDVGKKTHEPENPPEIASESISEGTACVPCANDHLSTCSGLLAEALRFARKDGIQSAEVISRVGLCNDELNAMERVDLRPELTMELPQWEKGIADTALKGSRGLRHNMADIASVEDLERVAGRAQVLRKDIGEQWVKGRMANMSQEEKERLKEKAQELLDKELQTGGE